MPVVLCRKGLLALEFVRAG
ncbi:hypothetical protein A2U01_0105439, partial [Trifolium medium]|nr:hypothetical protein [Trifolium medium]